MSTLTTLLIELKKNEKKKRNKGDSADVAVFDRQHNQTLRITDEQKEEGVRRLERREGSVL